MSTIPTQLPAEPGEQLLFVTFAIAFNPHAEYLTAPGQEHSTGDALFAALLTATNDILQGVLLDDLSSAANVIDGCHARLVGHAHLVDNHPHITATQGDQT